MQPGMFASFRPRMKYKVCLSGYNKAARNKIKLLKQQRVPQWEAELKYTVLVMSYLNSEFILLGITQKQGFRQFWFGGGGWGDNKNFTALSAWLPEDSPPSRGDTAGSREMV